MGIEPSQSEAEVGSSPIDPNLSERGGSQFKNNYFAEMCSGSEEGS